MLIDSYLKMLNEKIEKEPNYDINEFFSRLNKALSKHDIIEVIELEKAREYPILFAHPKKLSIEPRVLIATGFHGDESSGPWAVLNFLETYPYPKSVNLSLLPLVNPTGFNLSRRADFWGNNPNRGYTKSYDKSKATHEDEVLKKNIKLMSKYGKDCLVTLHEDDEENFYIFTYGEQDALDKKLLSMGEEKFGLVPADRLKVGGFKAKDDGARIDDKDGSFEHGMLVKGVKKNITTENPSRKPFKERVELYIEMIKEICKSKYYD